MTDLETVKRIILICHGGLWMVLWYDDGCLGEVVSMSQKVVLRCNRAALGQIDLAREILALRFTHFVGYALRARCLSTAMMAAADQRRNNHRALEATI